MLGLVSYLLLAPPIFVLAPLLGFLLLSSPRSLREWWWVLGIGVWLGFSLGQSGGLADQTITAWGVLLAGTLVVLRQVTRLTGVEAALSSAALSFLVLTVWAVYFGIGWRDFQLAVAHDGWEYCRRLLGQNGLEATFGAPRAAGLKTYVNAMADGVGSVSRLFPGLMVLTALPGLGLAWSWYQRISRNLPPEPSPGFRSFRFNDQLVWGAVVGVILTLFPLPEPAANVGGNLVLVFGGLYACRGLAVAWSAVSRLSGTAVMAIGFSLLFLLPVALGGLISLGLADTWLDFRRRLAPSSSGE